MVLNHYATQTVQHRKLGPTYKLIASSATTRQYEKTTTSPNRYTRKKERELREHSSRSRVFTPQVSVTSSRLTPPIHGQHSTHHRNTDRTDHLISANAKNKLRMNALKLRHITVTASCVENSWITKQHQPHPLKSADPIHRSNNSQLHTLRRDDCPRAQTNQYSAHCLEETAFDEDQ